MKLSKSTLMCMAALSGFALTGEAAAAAHEGFEFHGYFRTGVLASTHNDFKRATFPGQKETLGRLGLESDNDIKVKLIDTWDFDDGRAMRIIAGLSWVNKEASLSSSVDANEGGFDLAYVEFDGVAPSGTFWAGKREYGKENYIFMTDFFYTDMSGTGIGISGYEMGDAMVDFAYIASDRANESIDRWEEIDPDWQPGDSNDANLNNLLHAFQVGVSLGNWYGSAMFKAMPDNWDRDGKEWAEQGGDITLRYTMNSFFGLEGNAFSHIIGQAGIGLGAGNLLGGTITRYNGYKPGTLAAGQHDDWNELWGEGLGDAEYLLTHVDDDDTSARLLVWGGYTFENGIGFFPSVQGQYNDHETWGYNYWVSAMVRPVMPISQHMYLQGEVGYVHNNWGGTTWNQSKITIAPTFILPTGLGPAPEIRLLASYLPKSWTRPGEIGSGDDPKEDFIVGIQADVWW